jgi:large subunit ribosomal protein L13
MDFRSYKTISVRREDADKKWLVVDVQGMPLGRAASKIAFLLRGKHKPAFTPNIDCGDNVVVVNADKVRLTGRKLQQKEYLHHTGYPGGQRSVSASRMMAEKPERMIEIAVRGMLPKNRLGHQLLGNLRVYTGAEHPHAAQEPQPYQL